LIHIDSRVGGIKSVKNKRIRTIPQRLRGISCCQTLAENVFEILCLNPMLKKVGRDCKINFNIWRKSTFVSCSFS